MFYEKLIAWNDALERAFVFWFVDRGALLRIVIWIFVASGGLLVWSSAHETRQAEIERAARQEAFREAINDRDARRFRLTPTSLERLRERPEVDYFRIVIVGGSENFLVQSRRNRVRMNLMQGLATELEKVLTDVPGIQPVIIDASYPGTPYENRYLLVDYAIQLEPDLLLLTTDFGEVQRVVQRLSDSVSVADTSDLQAGFVENLIYQAPSAFGSGPAVQLDAILKSRFQSYASGFTASFRPWIGEVVEVEFQGNLDDTPVNLEHPGIELHRYETQRVTVDTALRSAAYDPGEHELLFAERAPSVARALEIVTAPATSSGIPVQIMISPAPQYFVPSSDKTYGWFEEEIEHYNQIMTQQQRNARAWNAGPEKIVQPNEFTDGMHFENFEPLATRLIEVLHENALLPAEWKTP